VILIGLGSNLVSEVYGSPKNILEEALRCLGKRGVRVINVSPFYETEPVPRSDQPWFVNAVAQLHTELSCDALLAVLHDIEREMGRVRKIRWEARIIDLDLLAYHDLVMPSLAIWTNTAAETGPSVMMTGQIFVPHPRLHQRRFVLLPLQDVAADWRHPVFRQTAEELLANSPGEQEGVVRKLE
tara:strand:- start:3893 stop:4444 length:552 start_codon:yes stop_codon:yes gene_type:complete